MRVQYSHPAEARLEAAARLRREADFWHENDRLATILNHFVDRVDIDFGLTAAGDTMQQDRLMSPLAERRENAIEGRLLVDIELEVFFAKRNRLYDLHLLNAAHVRFDQSLLSQLADWAERTLGSLSDLRRCQ